MQRLIEVLPNPGVDDLIRLQSILYYPEDQQGRSFYVGHQTVIVLGEEARAKGWTDHGISVPFWLLETLSCAPARADISNDIIDRSSRGEAAGSALLQYFSALMLRHGILGNYDEPFTAVVNEISAQRGHVARNPAKPGTSMAWFNSDPVWRTYKDVSHLWAAACVEHAVVGAPFPCEQRNYRRFLALADRMAEFMQKHTAPRQAATFFDPNTTWKIAPNQLTDADYDSAVEVFGEYHRLNQEAKLSTAAPK